MTGPRSLLFVPANRPDMLAKACSYGADALLLDREDSVPVDEKPKARVLARDFIGSHKNESLLDVRVNALQTGMLEDDLDAIAIDGLAAIRLSKTESADTVRTVDRRLAGRTTLSACFSPTLVH
jgi:citrate lyase subunit beta/citryl-CoA lyase